MDLSRNQEEGIPLPINSYGHGQVMHHHHHHQQQQQQDHDLLSSVEPQIPATYRGPTLEGHHQVPLSNKKGAMKVRYRECLKNHAASMGGNATDGCGEFMPSGAEGTIEALTCSACSCHRNFHRKETDHHHHHQPHILGHLHPQPLSLGCPTLIPLRAAASASARYNNTSADQYYNVNDHHRQVQFVKKRFRTKFTPEQKGKMLEFAERTGWRLQRQEEGVVQQFCQEIGVKRRVLKVWMHNNKHNLARKNDNNND